MINMASTLTSSAQPPAINRKRNGSVTSFHSGASLPVNALQVLSMRKETISEPQLERTVVKAERNVELPNIVFDKQLPQSTIIAHRPVDISHPQNPTYTEPVTCA